MIKMEELNRTMDKVDATFAKFFRENPGLDDETFGPAFLEDAAGVSGQDARLMSIQRAEKMLEGLPQELPRDEMVAALAGMWLDGLVVGRLA